MDLVRKHLRQGVTSIRAMQLLEDHKCWGKLIDSDPYLKGYYDGTLELVNLKAKGGVLNERVNQD